MKVRDLPILLSIILALLVLPATLWLVKINQDNRSQAMAEPSPLPTIPPINNSYSVSPNP